MNPNFLQAAFLAPLASFLLFGSAASAAEPSHMLFDFEGGFDVSAVVKQDANAETRAREQGHVLSIRTGTAQPWPGVTLRASGAPWDLSQFAYVAMAVRNTGSNFVTVNCRVDNPAADGTKNCVTASVTLAPSAEGTLRVPLKRYSDGTLGGKLFGMRGYPKSFGGEQTVDASRITQLLLFVNKPSAAHAFEIDNIRAEGRFVPPTASISDADPFIPFIDTFGQYRHRDWPGKIHSLDELQKQRETEARATTARPGPSEWNRFGGWQAGPQLKAAGFFRTEKHAGKWWLVDPEGRLFWSHGIDCVRMLDASAIEEREHWFEDFPGALPEFASFLGQGRVLKGHYAGRTVKTFSFAGANLQRKYGPDWRASFGEVVHRRLRHWGINTIGNWSDESVRLQRQTPYVDAISSSEARRIEGSEGYWGKFADPFDPSFRETLRKSMAGKKGRSAGDPWCIGFFSDNEIAWGDELSLSTAALVSPPDQPAKLAFIADLQAKYTQIAALNAAWGNTHSSWDALRDSRTAPDPERARPDLERFYSRIAEAYFRTAREAIKAAAPEQLYLGCRFAWVNPVAAAAAAKYCDVVSYNLYQRSVADFKFNGGADVPLIIGEFHFGALDRGLFHTGLVPTASQEDRAQAYASYVTGALTHPQFVGCHWFQYQDQPTTGRVYDEENYQIGFVDIADTPNQEIVGASREVGASLYTIRLAASVPPATDKIDLLSPDGSVRLQLGAGPDGSLGYAVQFDGQSRIERSPLGITIDGAHLGTTVEMGSPKTTRIAETFPWRGNKTLATNLCQATEVPIRSKTSGVGWILEARVFNDGVAFRYRVPGAGSRTVAGESTSWQLPADSTVWFQTDTVNYEGAYRSSRADQIPLELEAQDKKQRTHLGPPLTVAFSDGAFGLISEASLYRYSGMTLRPEGGAKIQAVFQDDPNGWPAEGPVVSPWRVIVLARNLNALVNSDLIPALCDPPDPKLFPQGINTPWIKPGKAPCTWMIYGNDGAQFHRQKSFVDAAAATACEYLLVDAGWRSDKWGWLQNGGNVWARAAELCRYATERNVGIVLWHAYPEGRDDSPGLTTIEAREEFFRECQKAGVKGVKIDFFDSESKATVEACEDLLRRSAQHQLMINFHGANKPTGEVRTWPNEIAREGIREQEYLLWDSIPLAHYGALPFTRLAAGHGDFLPGFVQARFLKNTTIIFQMASTIVFSSPFLCWPDNPEAYLESPLLQFIRTVPVTWDETRILPGSAIGESVVMARRKGAEWHIAALNCRAEARELELDLSWIDRSGKTLTLYRDGSTRAASEIASGLLLPENGKLSIALQPGGGFIAQVRPAKTFSGWK